LVNLEKFEALGISEKTLIALEKKWFEEPSPIQKQVIPLLLAENKNIIWQAATGTGKTAAFGIPLAEKIVEHKKLPQALIMAPTRELAIQVAEEVASFFSDKKINVITVYGGQSYNIQLRNLRKWADIVVWTPGRIIDHINRWTLVIDQLKYLILDEADEMLNMWFIDDIKKILTHTNDDKSMLLFSATMPKTIINVAKKYMGKYEVVAVKKEQMTTTQTDQIYFEVHERDKFEALCRIVDVEPDFFGIIFCRTKVDVERISSHLMSRWYSSASLHGDVQQRQREMILNNFKKKKLTILVATDVAARWIDVDDVTHVINYALPQDPESYVHRVGRTGRAGKKWTAITFVTPSEYKKILYIKRVTKTDIKLGKVPEVENIIAAKKIKIENNLENIVEHQNYTSQLEFAKSLLEKYKPEELVASILYMEYADELSENRYKSMSKVTIDRTGKSRLFIALWRAKWYNPPTLVDHIAKIAQIDARKIDEVRVMDDFSFITVPFEEAEIILHAFEKNRESGRRSLVSRAKENRGGGGNRGRSGSKSRNGGYNNNRYGWGWSRSGGEKKYPNNRQNSRWDYEKRGYRRK